MTGTAQDLARARYQQFFSSNLFGGAAVEAKPRHRAFGKRADQTTSEMFGDYKENTRAPQKEVVEFVPRRPYANAHERKLQDFRGSELLATDSANAGYVYALSHGRKETDKSHADSHGVLTRHGAAALRQYHLRSDGVMPGDNNASDKYERSAPAKLVPSDETWYSATEEHKRSEESTVAAKADRERNSSVMDLPKPVAKLGELVEADKMSECKRRNNMMYSDLFGRQTPDCSVGAATSNRLYRAKPPACDASWMTKMNADDSSSTGERGIPSAGRNKASGRSRLSGEGMFMEDNSSKVASYGRQGDSSGHWATGQSHMRSSVQIGDAPTGSPSGSPPRSPDVNDWNITELAITGLKENTDELAFRRDVMPGDCHIVKTSLNMDLVFVRHNPKSDDLQQTLKTLNSKGYGVKLLSTAKPN
ncbi:hypothetical protein FOL47_000310 [Perkinsus chesapeaki]|uniref:Uncharacterized protein n=1 Tax=Perkinsus chesapeaki TaxID=330153 RepID=A0A7J6MM23_PERCH|nr:hypothetical protein FOL47_000310 [Perkinsus chesapeaki]